MCYKNYQNIDCIRAIKVENCVFFLNESCKISSITQMGSWSTCQGLKLSLYAIQFRIPLRQGLGENRIDQNIKKCLVENILESQ